MSIYAISDLHLALSAKKPMDIFGDNWEEYMNKIKDNWQKTIKKEDIVIISGDISWAMYLNEAVEDFDYINKLNGIKIISKGNHDYWWESKTKIDNFLNEHSFDTIKILHNNCYQFEDWVICGAKGWGEEDDKLFDRELQRLELSLKQSTKYEGKKKIVSLHYPPFNEKFINLMKSYNVDICIYGHLHGESHKYIKNGLFEGINIQCVSADYLKFVPMKIGG